MQPAYDVTLTLAEKNAVFRWLQEGGYNPADFCWGQFELDEPVGFSPTAFLTSKLVHKATKYFFVFGGVMVVFTPAPNTKTATEFHNSSWETRKAYFMMWLRRLSLEIDAPDLWAIAVAEHEMIEASYSGDLGNKDFSRNEKKAISAKLDELKALLMGSEGLAQEQRQFVERQFKYLRESSERLGRKDWLNVVISTFIGIATSVLTDDQKRKWLLQIASDGFRWVWDASHLLT